jgi:hypothetical protein
MIGFGWEINGLAAACNGWLLLAVVPLSNVELQMVQH